MIIRLFALLLFTGIFFSCDGTPQGESDDPVTESNLDPDGVNAKSGGETSTYEDQAAQTGISNNSADYDGQGTSPLTEAKAERKKDSITYQRSPTDKSISPVRSDLYSGPTTDRVKKDN